jgi:TfuA protein
VTEKKVLPIIFVGPSLGRDDIIELAKVEVDLRPPVKRGDLENLPDGVRVVCIIDGVFYTEPSVSVREILKLLRRGVRVIGSSSMGALRAAELSGHGMEGVGEVFQMYRDGEINSDAEVALLFDPVTYETRGEPLVNIRFGLKRAFEDEIVTATEVDHLLRAAKETNYFELTYSMVFKKVAEVVSEKTIKRLKQYVADNHNSLNLKRLDAITLISYLNGSV